MEFDVLGPLRIRRDGAEVPLRGPLQRTLLAALVLYAGKPLPVGILTEALWPGQDGAQRLQVLVSRLRGLFDERDRIAFEQDAYRLLVRPGEVDADRFERLANDAAELAGADPERCAALAVEGLALWRGEPYGDLDVPLFTAERQRLSERRLELIELRYEAELRCDRPAAAVPALTNLVREFPLRERLCGLLMTALYRSGRQADALAAYRATRRTLVEELGLEPGPELRAVEQRILAGDPVTIEQPAEEPAVPAQLPHEVADFVGRNAELSELDGALAGARVCVLAGTAGVGKTALAIRWAHRVRDEFPDGQLYVDLRGFGPDEPVTAADALAGFLRELGVDGPAIPQDLAGREARFRTLTDGRRMLVVLDNARTADQVRPLLPGSPAPFVLVTSRNSLTGLAARAGARRVDLDRLPEADAVALVGAGLGPRADAEPDAVAALIAHCARLPLALRVATELINLRRGLRVAELVAELGSEQDRLDQLEVDEDAQASVRAVFSWSYRCLSPEAAVAFRRCGLFPGRVVDTYALAALTGAGLPTTRRVVNQLVQAHLVDQVADGRVQLHDLLRAYAIELARQTDGEADRAAALDRLFTYYLNATSAATAYIEPHELLLPAAPPPTDLPVPAFASLAEARRWLDAERANLLTLAAHAVHHGQPRVTTLLSEMLYRYLDYGFADIGLVLHQNALVAASTLGDRLAAAHATAFVSRAHTLLGNLTSALDYGRQAYESYLVLAPPRFHVYQLTRIAWAHYTLGDYQDALGCAEQALAECRDLPADAAIVRVEALRCVGVTQGQLGRHEAALPALLEAFDLVVAAGDRRKERVLRSNLGWVHAHLGQFEPAREHLEAVRDAGREINDPVTEAHVYELGDIYWALGRHEEAFTAVWRCLAAAREAGLPTIEARAINVLGRLHRRAGAPDVAIEHHRDALAISEQTGERYEQAVSHDMLGDAHAELGEHAAAREHWQRAVAVYRQLGLTDAADTAEKLASLR